MGVMSCFRNNCDSIMCDTWVEPVGYICYECKTEFENKYAGRKFSREKFLKKLQKFMDSPKVYDFDVDTLSECDDNKITAEELWKRY